jgi:hypothetical protein
VRRSDHRIPLVRHVVALLVLCIGATMGAAADSPPQDAYRVPSLPPGLAAVWRVDGRKLPARAAAWSVAAFSTDGALVGVSDESGTRIYRARDGALVRMFARPFATGQFAFSLAISGAGEVAIGRVGSVDLYTLARADEPRRYYCAGACGPVSAVAFSRDGRWLAFQAVRGALEPSPGLVTVVDLRADAPPLSLEATATRAQVLFAGDGGSLVAANVLRLDDSGVFGVRTWTASAGWRRVRDVPGALVPRGTVGPFALNDHLAAYQRAGRLELRELATGAVVWTAPLAPSLDAAGSAMKLDLVALAQNGELALSYESPTAAASPGALVLRRMRDGATLAMYDVADVSALAIAPDAGSFVYTTGAGRTYAALARVPK